MNSTITGIISLYTFISLAAQLFILWLVDFSPLNIRESYGNFKPYGILILVAHIIIFIFFQKQLLKQNAGASIWKLILASAIVSFISILLYQGIRQLVIMRGQYSYDILTVLRTTIAVAIVTSVIAAAVAVEIKKVKGIWRHVPTVIALGLLWLIKEYFPNVEW